MIKIAIFASGSGSNAENIIHFFRNNSQIQVIGVLSNKTDAYVLERAKRLHVPTFVFNRDDFFRSDRVLEQLKEWETDFIVLAGFLWKVPEFLVEAYDRRIVNIHPALLPRYGGKGMYGIHVHEAVVAAGERESGITIHYVNAYYDEGDTIFQARCHVEPGDSPEDVANKVHALEYEHFPRVIQEVVKVTFII